MYSIVVTRIREQDVRRGVESRKKAEEEKSRPYA